MQTSLDLDQALATARLVARSAGALALSFFHERGQLTVEKKGLHDLVSRADREVEDLIRAELAAQAPGVPMLGEERGGEAAGEGPLWVVDPIDGTLNFLRGVAHWCVSIALVDEGGLGVGVIFDPARDELFAARRGGGASLNGAPLEVSGTATLTEAVVEYGESHRVPKEPVRAAVEALRSRDVETRKLGAGALGITWVATGRTDAFFEKHLNPWDALAALCIAQEAGARANDFLGAGGVASGAPVLVSTPALYEELSGATAIG